MSLASLRSGGSFGRFDLGAELPPRSCRRRFLASDRAGGGPGHLVALDPAMIDPAAWARLQHWAACARAAPGAVGLRDGGVEAGVPWHWFDPPRGQPLSEVIGRFDNEARRGLLARLAEKLAELDAAGLRVGHLRDDDVFFEWDGAVRVSVVEAALTERVRSTERGETLELRDAMTASPEFFAGREPEASVWPFAMFACYVLSGGMHYLSPHKHSTLRGVSAEVLTRPFAPPTQVYASRGRPLAVPSAFDAWFAACTARAVAQRPADVRTAYASLERVFQGEPFSVGATPYEPPVAPPVIFSNPKGSMYERGLHDRFKIKLDAGELGRGPSTETIPDAFRGYRVLARGRPLADPPRHAATLSRIVRGVVFLLLGAAIGSAIVLALLRR